MDSGKFFYNISSPFCRFETFLNLPNFLSYLGQLRSHIYNLILAISLKYPDELQQQFNVILAGMQNETNESTLINVISTVTNMVEEYNNNHHLIQINFFDKEMIHLKEKHDALQAALTDIEQKSGQNLENVKFQLQVLFNGLSNVIHHQNKTIVELQGTNTLINPP